MDIIPWLITCVCIYLLARRPKPQALPNARLNELTDRPAHELARITASANYQHWRCHCGAYGIGYDEAGALNQYQKHEALYDDTYKTRYERLEQEFAEFKDRCYCKDIT